MIMGLYKELVSYRINKNIYPMHMPGHKRNSEWIMMNPYEIDITEIDGFDNLTRPQGIIKDCMKRAADVYKCSDTYMLVNGSTAGILTAVSAMTRQGDTILIMRNSHMSVYNAAFLNKLCVQYLYPDVINELGILGGVCPESIEEKLTEYPKTSLVIITSPTYDGVISDIKGIAEIVHKHNIPLLVDAAHGAHLGFHPYFYENAAGLGADCVIHSIHKTLPAFTQTALMHVSGSYVNRREIKRYLSVYQTSSPSYILMAGIDRCITFLENEADKEFSRFAAMLKDFYCFSDNFKNICVLKPEILSSKFKRDLSKIIIYCKNDIIKASVLYDILINRFNIQPEMAGENYVLCLSSVCDTEEGFDMLKRALSSIDADCGEIIDFHCVMKAPETLIKNTRRFYHFEMSGKTEKMVLLKQSGGCVMAEYVYLYPPGIPLLVPGEVMSLDMIDQIQRYMKAGLNISGMEDMSGEYVRVLA